MEKLNQIQLTKNKMDLINRKITHHPPSHVQIFTIQNNTLSAAAMNQNIILSSCLV